MKTLQDRIDAIREEFQDQRPDLVMVIDELVESQEWRPIETAPKDGRDILLTDGEEVAQASYWAGEWMLNIGNNPCCHQTWYSVMGEPTRWMPLPQPPKAGD